MFFLKNLYSLFVSTFIKTHILGASPTSSIITSSITTSIKMITLLKIPTGFLPINPSIVLTMIGISNSNKTCYQNGCQSRTNACI